ncbi:MAG: UDP-N-acetylmuramoylalanyl-D-glutamyl-2,6-diaminopimelate--D-alanyl-D-alanine ligase, partial [Pseudomonadota bacterium]
AGRLGGERGRCGAQLGRDGMTKEILWTAEAAATATGGALCAKGGPEDEWTATGVSIDTRTLEPGDLFVALKDVRDGHAFVANAFEAGAAAALVSHAPESLPEGAPLLMVPDVLQGLRDMGAAARTRAKKRVAVTGSVGKTSTKEMLRAALSVSGKTHASVKSFNNHWGVPITLARMAPDTEYGVFEIGMNHAGEITPLTKFAAPDVAIITIIGEAHIEFFDSKDGIAEAKAEIFFGLKEGGAAILNRDDPYFDLLANRAKERGAGRILTFGAGAGADVRVLKVSETSGGSRIEAEIFGEQRAFDLSAFGRHQAMNAAAVIAAAHALGAPLDNTLKGLGALVAVDGRGARGAIPASGGGAATLIDESYNANPTSMAAAAAVLKSAVPGAGGRRIAVLGDMLELGEDGPGLHAALADVFKDAEADKIYAAGPLMAHMWAGLPEAVRGAHAETTKELVDAVASDIRAGDVVMVKGSLGMKMSVIIEALKSQTEPARKQA